MHTYARFSAMLYVSIGCLSAKIAFIIHSQFPSAYNCLKREVSQSGLPISKSTPFRVLYFLKRAKASHSKLLPARRKTSDCCGLYDFGKNRDWVMDRNSHFFIVKHNRVCDHADLTGFFNPPRRIRDAGLPGVSPICPDRPAGIPYSGIFSELFRSPDRPTWAEPP